MIFFNRAQIALTILVATAGCGDPNLETELAPIKGEHSTFLSDPERTGYAGNIAVYADLTANRTMKVGSISLSIKSERAADHPDIYTGLLNFEEKPIIDAIMIQFGTQSFIVNDDVIKQEIVGNGRWFYILRDLEEELGDEAYTTIEDNQVFRVRVSLITDERRREYADILEVRIELLDLVVRNDDDTLWVVDPSFSPKDNPTITEMLHLPAPAAR